MKKINYLVFLVVLSVFAIQVSYAASISVKASSSSVTIGNTVKVTVTVNGTGSSSGKVGAWEYCVSYDSSMLTLSSSTANSGGACVTDGVVGVTSATTTFTFKAKASGTSTVSLSSVALYDYSTEQQMSVSKGSVNITAKTQAEVEASYSTNAYLNSLSVSGYDISPSFSKETLEYSLEVENDVEEVTIKASKADSGASVSGTGTKSLTEGVNTFNIVVTAEKGNKKTYVLTITRKELNPIYVTVGDVSYTIVRDADALETPSYYSSTTIEIDGEEVPAFVSEITGYTLVGLKDDEGNINLYIYNDGEYVLYRQVSVEAFTFVILDTDSLMKGYENTKVIKINDMDVTVYVNDDSEFVLIYGMNVSTGETGWYKYDTIEGTIQRYEEIQENVESNDKYFILTIVFAIIAGLSILLNILLMFVNSKIKKKNNKMFDMLKGNKNIVNDKGALEEENLIEEDKVQNSDFDDNLSAEETIIQAIAKSNEESLISDDTASLEDNLVEEVADEEGEETRSSRKERKRKEKEQKQKDKEEIKKMQDDFLNTEEHNFDIEETIQEEEVQEEEKDKPKKKAKRSRKKKVG